MRLRLSAAVLCVASAGCGGNVDGPASGEGRDDGTGGTPSGGAGGMGGLGAAATPAGTGAVGSGGSMPKTPYDDPGCPDVPPPPPVHECDPFASVTGCGFGERCVPFVRYADECQSESFGTICAVAGDAEQGEDCTGEPCAAEHVCVTTGQGNQCAKICTLSGGRDDCAPGLLCQPLDVDGFYICF